MTTRHERQSCDTTTIDQFRHTEIDYVVIEYTQYNYIERLKTDAYRENLESQDLCGKRN